ncbi:MAG: tetratricopeptide repeat protein [Candidatus Omnitrophota bacterium]|jgi:tetratricopeptide (TPR) repeat protein
MNKELSGLMSVLLIAAAIVCAGALSYLNSLANPFIWDDIALVTRNLHIIDVGYIPRLFLEGSYHQEVAHNFYRPFLMASFALDYHSWGLQAFGYHLTNIFLHLSNALLVYCLVWTVSGRRTVSLITALLFTVHPVHTEAVAYISGRGDPLAAFFSLVSMICFIRFSCAEGRNRAGAYLCSLVFFSIAVFTKESALMLPVFFVLYSACFGKRRPGLGDILAYVPFLAVAAAYLYARKIALSGAGDPSIYVNSIPFASRLLTSPAVVLEYVKMLAWPAGLHMERMDFLYDFITSLKDPRFVASSVFLAAAITAVVLRRRNSKLLFFGTAWFLAGLLPFLNLIPVNAFVAEHWLYFPSIGFFIAVSILFDRMLGFRSIRLCVQTFIAVIVAMLAAVTIRQNHVWRDPVYFYNYTLRFSPGSARVHTNLGIEYFDRGMFEKAEKEYKTSLELEPNGKNTVYHLINLAALYFNQGREREAFETYRAAIAADPAVPVTYIYIGDIYYGKGKYPDAAASYKKAAELAPQNAVFWNKLGNAYLAEKMYDEAAAAYKRAVGIYPNLLDARVNLGEAYAKKGDLVASLNEYKAAMQIDPGIPEIYTRISNICSRMGAHEQAKYFSDRAKELLTK